MRVSIEDDIVSRDEDQELGKDEWPASDTEIVQSSEFSSLTALSSPGSSRGPGQGRSVRGSSKRPSEARSSVPPKRQRPADTVRSHTKDYTIAAIEALGRPIERMVATINAGRTAEKQPIATPIELAIRRAMNLEGIKRLSFTKRMQLQDLISDSDAIAARVLSCPDDDLEAMLKYLLKKRGIVDIEEEADKPDDVEVPLLSPIPTAIQQRQQMPTPAIHGSNIPHSTPLEHPAFQYSQTLPSLPPLQDLDGYHRQGGSQYWDQQSYRYGYERR